MLVSFWWRKWRIAMNEMALLLRDAIQNAASVLLGSCIQVTSLMVQSAAGVLWRFPWHDDDRNWLTTQVVLTRELVFWAFLFPLCAGAGQIVVALVNLVINHKIPAAVFHSWRKKSTSFEAPKEKFGLHHLLTQLFLAISNSGVWSSSAVWECLDAGLVGFSGWEMYCLGVCCQVAGELLMEHHELKRK